MCVVGGGGGGGGMQRRRRGGIYIFPAHCLQMNQSVSVPCKKLFGTILLCQVYDELQT